MPVKLEIITTLNDADRLDLSKIHDETSPQGFTLTADALAAWLGETRWVFAGRFNDRLIGAILAEQQGDQIQLHSAGVRAITQRRGVMHQMLHFITRWANDHQKNIVVTDCPPALIEPLSKRGFVNSNEQWVLRTTN